MYFLKIPTYTSGHNISITLRHNSRPIDQNAIWIFYSPYNGSDKLKGYIALANIPMVSEQRQVEQNWRSLHCLHALFMPQIVTKSLLPAVVTIYVTTNGNKAFLKKISYQGW